MPPSLISSSPDFVVPPALPDGALYLRLGAGRPVGAPSFHIGPRHPENIGVATDALPDIITAEPPRHGGARSSVSVHKQEDTACGVSMTFT